MFDRFSQYYDDIYSFLDYETASDKLLTIINQHAPNAENLLDVACGTGRYIEYLKTHLTTEGLDINPALLQIASRRCPDTSFHEFDMRTFELGKTFEVITCLFCSIGYLIELEDVEMAFICMARHLKPGGTLIIEPWITPEKCWTNKVSSEVLDRPDLKIVRMHTHEKVDRTSIFDIHNLIGTPGGVEHFVEREVMGLYTHDEYLAALKSAGIEAAFHDTWLFPGHAYGLFIGKKH